MPKLRIGAKNLGLPLIEYYCPRCLWILASMTNKYPFWRPLPKIIYTLDEIEKACVERYIQAHKKGPKWMGPFRDVVEPLDIDRIDYTDPDTGLHVRGRVDAVHRLADGSIQIIDYKTANFKGGEDAFLPLYEAQVNTYAFMLETEKYGYNVDRVGLVYFQTLGIDELDDPKTLIDSDGLRPAMKAIAVPVNLDPEEMTRPLISEIADVLQCSEPPEGREGCADCKLMAQLLKLVSSFEALDSISRPLLPAETSSRVLRDWQVRQSFRPRIADCLHRELEEYGELCRHLDQQGVAANWSDEDFRDAGN